MRQLITAIILATVAVTAQAAELTPTQQRWLYVYNEQIAKVKFAIQVQNNDAICMGMNVAKEAALNIGDKSFYESHIKLMKNLRDRGALCYGWSSL